jgi:hypothetical protein
MPKACPDCGTANTIQAKACESCGVVFGSRARAIPIEEGTGPTDPPTGTGKLVTFLVLFAIVAAMAWGCSALGGEEDSGARQACRKFDALLADVSAGIVADSELRPRLQSIDDSAIATDDTSIRTSARRLLSANTAGDTAAFAAAADSMANACRDVNDG